MNLPFFMQTLGSIPLFASRAFLAAFVTALLAKYGDQVPLLGSVQGMETLQNAPEWFTSQATLLVLGVLAGLEFLATKSPEAREMLNEVDSVIKTGVSMLVSAALIDKETAAVIAPIQQSGFSLGYVWAGLTGAAVWTISNTRKGVLEFLSEMDEDDDLGVQGLINWAEDGFVFLGFLFLVVLPMLALIMFGLAVLGLFIAHRYVLRFEKKSFIPCEKCGEQIHPSASQCFSCNNSIEAPKQIGALGQATNKLATDHETHRLRLLSKKRCTNCALRLKERTPKQECSNCGTIPFADSDAIEQYLAAVKEKLNPTLGVCFLLGFIPVLGLVPGIIYYRLSLVSSIRGYLPRIRNFTSRWMIRFINLFLICLQPIPILGAFVLPLMCFTNYSVYQKALRKEAASVFDETSQ